MSEERPVNRRSFLARVGGAAVLAGGGLALFGPTEAEAQRYCTDRDPYDPVGRGRRCRRRRRYTGITDRDPSDPAGYGRGWRRRRRYTGITDRDPYDPVGNGRGRRRRRRYVTDSDPYDPVGRGRG